MSYIVDFGSESRLYVSEQVGVLFLWICANQMEVKRLALFQWGDLKPS